MRQGDVRLIPIAPRELPAGLEPVQRDGRGRLVLAAGEVTVTRGSCPRWLGAEPALWTARRISRAVGDALEALAWQADVAPEMYARIAMQT
jgi:hypothetical protein